MVIGVFVLWMFECHSLGHPIMHFCVQAQTWMKVAHSHDWSGPCPISRDIATRAERRNCVAWPGRRPPSAQARRQQRCQYLVASLLIGWLKGPCSRGRSSTRKKPPPAISLKLRCRLGLFETAVACRNWDFTSPFDRLVLNYIRLFDRSRRYDVALPNRHQRMEHCTL